MLAFLGLCLRQHYQFFALDFFVKNNFLKIITKNEKEMPSMPKSQAFLKCPSSKDPA